MKTHCRLNLPFFLLKAVSVLLFGVFSLGAVSAPSHTEFFASTHSTIQLPTLGDSTGSIVSPIEEHQLGQSFLRIIYQQASINEDALIRVYIENLSSGLINHSPLTPKAFSLVIMNYPEINAFAAPGTIIGINLGLILQAETEDEVASVIAHDIGHLTQRHYARSLARKKSQQLVSIGSLLGGLLIAASGQADAGIATMQTGMGLAAQQQLKYSRQDEQEADRIGISTLYSAGFNPKAAADMFQVMQKSMRYREDIQQISFLLTHPLTESRISDATLQANSYPNRKYRDSFEFHLVKARIKVLQSKNIPQTIDFFKRQVTKYPMARDYGLAISLLADNKALEAKPIIEKLYQQNPHKVAFVVAKAELLIALNKAPQAIKLLKKQLALQPQNTALLSTLSKAFQQNQQPAQAAKSFTEAIKNQSAPPAYLWRQLSELYGLAGNISEVHRSRAEYFIAIGQFKDAERHLKLALPMSENNRQISAKIRTRLTQLKEIEKVSKLK
ncbi:MAG: M48 family metalloprotease [Cellvibrionales bacterium]|nr:M48 family metalloprotease [Cellvibrionales bacterium]